MLRHGLYLAAGLGFQLFLAVELLPQVGFQGGQGAQHPLLQNGEAGIDFLGHGVVGRVAFGVQFLFLQQGGVVFGNHAGQLPVRESHFRRHQAVVILHVVHEFHEVVHHGNLVLQQFPLLDVFVAALEVILAVAAHGNQAVAPHKGGQAGFHHPQILIQLLDAVVDEDQALVYHDGLVFDRLLAVDLDEGVQYVFGFFAGRV